MLRSFAGCVSVDKSLSCRPCLPAAPPAGTSRDRPRGLHPPRKEAYLDGPARLLLPQTINNVCALDAVVDAVGETQKRPCSGQHRHSCVKHFSHHRPTQDLDGDGTAPSDRQCVESRRLRLRHALLRPKWQRGYAVMPSPARPRWRFNTPLTVQCNHTDGNQRRKVASPDGGGRSVGQPLCPHPVAVYHLVNLVYRYIRGAGVVRVDGWRRPGPCPSPRPIREQNSAFLGVALRGSRVGGQVREEAQRGHA